MNFKKTRIEAENFCSEQFFSISSACINERLGLLAAFGRNDLYFLLTQLLGRQDLRHNWIYERCNEVMHAPDGYLDLWAREHCKSSIITFGLTIQSILKDPETSIGIFSHTRSMAQSFLAQIKREFECNELLKACYPEILWASPNKEAPLWSLEKGLIVKRCGNPKEATLESWGLVDGQPIGKHFNIMVFDDVVTRESVNTSAQITKTTDAWALALNLGSREAKKRYIGTRYHSNDSYKTILERKAAIARVYPATHNGEPDGQPVLMSKKLLDQKRREMGPYIFGCQMLQNPLADEAQAFKEPWLRFWEPQNQGLLEKDALISSQNCNWSEFNRYILVDPAGERKRHNDYTVMLVIGLAPDNNWYLIDGIRDRLNLNGRAEALFKLHQRYLPDLVGYEKYGMQADVEFIESEQERRNYRFAIVNLGGAVPKNDRIKALMPYFEQGRIYIPKSTPFRSSDGKWHDLTTEFINEEYLFFPISSHDDMLDCFARILDPKLGAVFPSSYQHNADFDEPTIFAETDYKLF